MRQQRLADSPAAEGGTHVEVFEIEAAAAAEGREIGEPKRLPRDFAVPFGDLAMGRRAGQRRLDHRLRRVDLVREVFVFREFADQREHEAGVFATGAS